VGYFKRGRGFDVVYGSVTTIYTLPGGGLSHDKRENLRVAEGVDSVIIKQKRQARRIFRNVEAFGLYEEFRLGTREFGF